MAQLKDARFHTAYLWNAGAFGQLGDGDLWVRVDSRAHRLDVLFRHGCSLATASSLRDARASLPVAFDGRVDGLVVDAALLDDLLRLHPCAVVELDPRLLQLVRQIGRRLPLALPPAAQLLGSLEILQLGRHS